MENQKSNIEEIQALIGNGKSVVQKAVISQVYKNKEGINDIVKTIQNKRRNRLVASGLLAGGFGAGIKLYIVAPKLYAVSVKLITLIIVALT